MQTASHPADLAADQLDEHGMMALAGAIVAQAAADVVNGRTHSDRSNEYDPADFLEAAGVLHRVADIVAYSPRLAMSRKTRATRQVAA